MNRLAWIVTAVVSLFGLTGYWVLTSQLEYRNTMTPRGVPRDISNEDLAKVIEQVREEAVPTTRGDCRAVVPENDHDFGISGVHKGGEHTFVIRNEGTDPLQLGTPVGDSFCDALLHTRTVAPGSETKVKVLWATGGKTQLLRGHVNIPTSDPASPVVTLNVRGQVYEWIKVSPREINIPAVSPGTTPQVRSGYIFSAVWQSFAIGEIVASGGVRCDVIPATPSELAQNEAISGYRIEMHVPADGEGASYGANVDIPIEPPAEFADERMTVHFPVNWKVYRRFCLYSKSFSAQKVVDLGIVKPGSSKTATIRVKIHDPLPELPGARFEVSPSFIKARLISQDVGSSPQGNFIIEIEIPDDAPTGSHLRATDHGEVRFITDHPRIPGETLSLRFAVIGEDRHASFP